MASLSGGRPSSPSGCRPPRFVAPHSPASCVIRTARPTRTSLRRIGSPPLERSGDVARVAAISRTRSPLTFTVPRARASWTEATRTRAKTMLRLRTRGYSSRCAHRVRRRACSLAVTRPHSQIVTPPSQLSRRMTRAFHAEIGRWPVSSSSSSSRRLAWLVFALVRKTWANDASARQAPSAVPLRPPSSSARRPPPPPTA